MRFDDQVVIVTGSSRGIGRAIALGFAQRGAKVVVNYVHGEAAANAVAKEIERLGSEAMVIQADMAKPDQVSMMINRTLAEWHRIDVLVNNAGISRRIPLEETTMENYLEIIQVNQHGVVETCRAVIPQMLKQKYGRIVNIASIAAQIGCTNCLPYCTSKAAVIGITRSLAFELATTGITVNCVAPGSIETDMLLETPRDILESFKGPIPMKRFGKPEELAYGVIFLASKGASFITGQVLGINGGQHLSS